VTTPHQRLLWFIGGFDRQVLEMDECQSIRSKYSSIGGLILMTAVLAVCSGGFAVYTISDRVMTALPIALLWGTFILLLDRYLVGSDRRLATMREFHTSLQVTPPFIETWRWSHGAALAVRLLLSGFIGFVVAKPIEMAILEPWILDQYRIEQDADAKGRENASDLGRQDRLIEERQKELDNRQRELERRRQILSDEIGGVKGSGKVGVGPIALAQQELLAQAQEDYKRDRETLDNDRARRQQEVIRVTNETADRHRARIAARSVISDLGAIHEIERGGGSKATLVSAVSIFLSVFLVIIEITPVLAKAVAKFDPYDAVLLEREHHAILQSLVVARQAHEQAFAQVVEP
jgi:hypothetical protein